ncbi:MAG: hypothetical protein NVS9B15_21090 [Acidobacteriaceae bacterium]
MSKPRILLVDDDKDGITTLTAILVGNNFEVTPASSVKSALHCIATGRV